MPCCSSPDRMRFASVLLPLAGNPTIATYSFMSFLNCRARRRTASLAHGER